MTFNSGNLKTLGTLEKAIAEHFKVAVVFRLSNRYRIYDRLGVANLFNKRLRTDMTVGEWRDVFVHALHQAVAKRGEEYVPKFDVTDIAFVSPRGITVHGNTLIKTIQFNTGL